MPAYGQAVTIDDNLNFTISRINFDGQLFQAELQYQSDNIFTINSISAATDAVQGRGKLIDFKQLNEVSKTQLNSLISLYKLQTGTTFDLQAMNDVVLYKITYQTVDPAGKNTRASALIGLPEGVDGALPLLAYQHETIVARSEAPTAKIMDIPTLGLSGNGYVTVSSDFIGFGDSTALHPYVHAKSLAIAVIDALRATRELMKLQSVTLNEQLFLLGYSEGGYATMALQRELERNHTEEFNITASAPMAGPYDISGTMVDGFLDDAPHPNPYYFPYTLLPYNEVYGLTDNLGDYFKPPYNTEISGLFDGKHSGSEINKAIPYKKELFTENLYKQLAPEENSWVKASMAENDLYRWKPAAKTYLFHCVRDNMVPFENSQVAYDSFQARGATEVELISVENTGYDQGNVHVNCAIPLMLMGKSYFDALR